MNAAKLDPRWLLYGAIVLGVGYVAWRLTKAAPEAIKAVGQAVNPVSDKNLAYRGVNAVGAAVTGDDDWSLGTWLATVTGADKDKQISDMLKGKTAPGTEPAVDVAGIGGGGW